MQLPSLSVPWRQAVVRWDVALVESGLADETALALGQDVAGLEISARTREGDVELLPGFPTGIVQSLLDVVDALLQPPPLDAALVGRGEMFDERLCVLFRGRIGVVAVAFPHPLVKSRCAVCVAANGVFGVSFSFCGFFPTFNSHNRNFARKSL